MTLNRRNFIQTSTLLTLGAGVVTMSHADQHNSQLTIACRDAHLTNLGEESVWQAAKNIGVSGLEVWVNDDRSLPYLFHPNKSYSIKSPDAIKELADDAAEHDIKITAFAMPNRFDERLDFELAWVQDVVNAAKSINVPAIRIDVVPRRLGREEFLEFAIDAGKRICAMVIDSNVKYGIENHGTTTNDPEFLELLFNGVDDDSLGLTLDTANFYWFGHPLEDLYGIFEKFAPRAFHTHCKSIDYPDDKENTTRPMGWEYGKYNAPIYDGDIDFEKVVSILKDANYQNDLCIENESLGKFEDKAEVLTKEAQYLKDIVA